MADSELNIWVKLKDDASSAISGIKGKLEDMAPTFQKMAGAGTVAFGAIAGEGVLALSAFGEAQKSLTVANTALTNGMKDLSATQLAQLSQQAGKGNDAMKFLQTSMLQAGDSAAKLGVNSQTAQQEFAKLFSTSHSVTQAQSDLKLAMDLSAYSGKSLSESVDAVTKVHAGSTRVLKDFGIQVGSGTTSLQALQLIQDKVGGSAQAMGGTIDGQTAIMKEQFQQMQVSIGSALAPALEKLTALVIPVIEKVTNWIEQNPKLTATVLAVAGAIAGTVAVVGTLGLILPTIIAGFGLLSVPVLVVIGIIGGLILIIHNVIAIFDLLHDHGAEVWEGLKIMFHDAVQWIYDNSLGKLIGWIKDIDDALNNLLTKAQNFIGGVGGKIVGAVSSLASPFMGRAGGGDVNAGSPYIVGESGAEYFVPTVNGRIIPNGGMGGDTYQISVTGNTLLDKNSAVTIGNYMVKALMLNKKI